MVGDVRSQKICAETLVRPLWRAAAPGLKPLRLSRAQNGEFWKRTQGKWRPRFESSPPSGQ